MPDWLADRQQSLDNDSAVVVAHLSLHVERVMVARYSRRADLGVLRH